MENNNLANLSNQNHSVMIENRGKVVITGVLDVGSFDEKAIMLSTTLGNLEIIGNSLKIDKLNVENGELFIEGEIDSLSYADIAVKNKGGFFSRIFK
jgi:sporulation protein YabP